MHLRCFWQDNKTSTRVSKACCLTPGHLGVLDLLVASKCILFGVAQNSFTQKRESGQTPVSYSGCTSGWNQELGSRQQPQASPHPRPAGRQQSRFPSRLLPLAHLGSDFSHPRRGSRSHIHTPEREAVSGSTFQGQEMLLLGLCHIHHLGLQARVYGIKRGKTSSSRGTEKSPKQIN